MNLCLISLTVTPLISQHGQDLMDSIQIGLLNAVHLTHMTMSTTDVPNNPPTKTVVDVFNPPYHPQPPLFSHVLIYSPLNIANTFSSG